MPDTIAGLAGAAARRQEPIAAVKRATIRTTATVHTQPVDVSIDAQPTSRRGPCFGWQPRVHVNGTGGTVVRLPMAGDSCAVVELNDWTLWILAWWPNA